MVDLNFKDKYKTDWRGVKAMVQKNPDSFL